MRKVGFTFRGKRYVWAPKAKHIVAWTSILCLLVVGAGSLTTANVSASTHGSDTVVEKDDSKSLDFKGMLYEGDAKVTYLNSSNYDGSFAMTEYGSLPILASNSSAAKPGELVYLELGNTGDSDKCTVYWCIDGKDLLKPGTVGLINQPLTGNSYDDIAVYSVVSN